MHIYKLSLRTVILSVTLFAVLFTFGLYNDEVDAATYKLNKKKASVYTGKKVKLKVLTKSGKATKKKIKWKSSNKKIATVSKYGNVKGKKKGKVKIYAKVAKKTFKSVVTVKKPVQRINTKSATVKAGQTVSLKMLSLKKEKVKGKKKKQKPKVTWSSSNKSIATVSKAGKVTTHRQGSAKITAKVGKKKKKYSCTVYVQYPNYTIGTNSTPIKTDFKSYSGYTSKSRQYYTIRSYLEVFETAGGGTLTLTGGTYNITNTLYVPSNVTIHMASGVHIKKSMSTGTSKLSPSKSMFQLCAPSKAKVANGYSKGKYRYGYTGYNGVSNVNIFGYGSVVIDNNSVEDSLSLIMGHNNNVNIANITFQNMNYGHFIEANSSANVNITNCVFQNGVGGNKEAINIDTPDIITNGFSSPWSSFDKTPVTNLTVNSCSFLNLPTAVGSHRYSYGSQHTNVKILNSTIKNTSNNGIYALNWKDCTISGNKIEGINRNGNVYRGIKAGGAVNLKVTNNYFNNMARVIQIHPISLNNYPPIYSDMDDNIDEFIEDKGGSNSYGSDITQEYIRYNKDMKDDNKATDWTKYTKIDLETGASVEKGGDTEGGEDLEPDSTTKSTVTPQSEKSDEDKPDTTTSPALTPGVISPEAMNGYNNENKENLTQKNAS